MTTSTRIPMEAARFGAVVALRPELRTLEVRGPDRLEFLDGMFSQDLRSLRPGGGVRALKCTAKGRIEAYVRVRATEEALLVDVRAEVKDRLERTLSDHIVMEDCTVRDISGQREVLALLGPWAYQLLEAVGLGAVSPDLPPEHFEVIGSVTVIRDTRFGRPGYELHVPSGSGAKREAALIRAGAVPVGPAVMEVLRVEAGEPRDGAELDLETLPMEARLEHAISLTKGCYVGQEVVARGTNLGQVNHLLVGLVLLDGPPREPGPSSLSEGDKPVGEIESVVFSEHLGQHIALGYVRREYERPGQTLGYPTPLGVGRATVVELPFIPAGEASG